MERQAKHGCNRIDNIFFLNRKTVIGSDIAHAIRILLCQLRFYADNFLCVEIDRYARKEWAEPTNERETRET